MKMEPMSDNELAEWLNIAGDLFAPAFIRNLPAGQRALYERMRQIELWEKGDAEAELPQGVLVDFQRERKRG